MRFNYKKITLVIVIAAVMPVLLLVFGDGQEDESKRYLVECLEQAGVVIYGSVTCPFCTELANEFGGYEVIDPIYVECTEEPDRCDEEMIGRGVPEIQVEGEVYQGSREPAAIGQAVGCEM